MVNRLRINSAQSIFFWNITINSCQSRVSAWFCNSASNTDFYQMFLSQTAILHDVNEEKSYSVWPDLYQSQTTTQTHIH